MDKSELDLIIKVQLFAHRNNSTGVDAKKHKDKERERIMQHNRPGNGTPNFTAYSFKKCFTL
jgi:hypothetical protein